MHNSGDGNSLWMLRWLQQRQMCDTHVDIYTYICIHCGYWGFKSSKYTTSHIHCFFKTPKWNISVFFQIHLEFGCFSFGHAFGLPPSTPLPRRRATWWSHCACVIDDGVTDHGCYQTYVPRYSGCLQYGSLIVHRSMSHTSGIVTSHRSAAMRCYNLLYIWVKMSRVFQCTNNTNLQRGWSDLAMVSLFQ